MQFFGVRCAIVSILLLAVGCATDDGDETLPAAPAARVAAVDSSTTTVPSLLVVDGDAGSNVASSNAASSTASATSTSTLTSEPTTLTSEPTTSTAGAATTITETTNSTLSRSPSTAPGTQTTTADPPPSKVTTSTAVTTAAEQVPSTTEPAATTTQAPTSRPGAFIDVDFQSTPTGTYDDGRIRADWGGGAVRYSSTDGRAAIVDESGNRFVRVRFPQGKVGPSEGGSQWAVNLGSNASDELFISYRVRFVGDFDFVRGGKLPGLSGGDSNTGGRKPNGDDGWSSRIMWRPQGAAVQYVYHPDQPTIYGDDLGWGQTFPADRWITVETRIKMNTPGRRNGVVQSWMDGRLVLDRTDIRFRDTADFQIDRFLFDTFFGGNSPEWAPTKEEHIDFDDFVVSGSPITH